MTDHVQNPITKRFIKTDGVLYKKLQSQGIKFEKPKLINSNFSVDRANTPWGKKKPHKIGERRELLEKCGKDAFLLPDKLKFPICNKIDKKNKKCTYNCRGLKAASSRAGQWKYEGVLKKSKEITKTLGCYKNKGMEKKENK